ncbi:unnamed protein product, partial [Nesidiocoris tenuis]
TTARFQGSNHNQGTASDEAYKGRKWTTGGDGHYSLVVSADDHELHPQESVGYALVLQEKKMGKIKPSEEMAKLLLDKYDKVTERLIMKENRKRQRLVASVDTSGNRKRRRNPAVASTTGLPQTMSYNLYNHFRPLEQDVPQDHILPFLDFGRKLSTGSTPSGANSIELSSTPRISQVTTDEPSETRAEEQLLDEMDVTVARKAAERNSPPRTPPLKPKKSTIISFFSKPVTTSNETDRAQGHIWSTVNTHNKTDSGNYSHHDLQPNESSHKPQIILSPDYGLRLKKTMAASDKNQASSPTETVTQSSSTTTSTTRSPEPEAPDALNATEIRSDLNAVPELSEDEVQSIPILAAEPDIALTKAASETVQVPSIIALKDPLTNADIMPLELVKSEPKLEDVKEIKIKDKAEEMPKPVELKADRPKLHPIPDPSPTARILSTAVVTSVSVKESPRLQRGRNNHTSEVHHRINPMKPDASHTPVTIMAHKNSSDWLQENRTALLQNLSRRKFTTFRPKTTSTFRTVTFRNQFRRNSTSHAPATVHVVSTPPSYIEVPRIAPIFRNRAQPGNFARKINSHLNAALTLANQTSNTTTAPRLMQATTVTATTEQPESNSEIGGSTAPRTEEKAHVIEVKTAPIKSDASTTVALEKSYHQLTQEAAVAEHLPDQPAIVQVSTSTEVNIEAEVSSTPESSPQSPTVHIRTEKPSTLSTTSSTTTPVPSFSSETSDTPLPSEEPVTNLEIEFRPLEVLHPSSASVPTERTTTPPAVVPKNRTTEPSTTSPRPSNFTIPHIPDLLWVYGQRNNHSVKTQPSTVGVAFHDTTWGVATYVLMALGTIPLLLGTLILVRQILLRSKKKVLDESEYSSEYNRSPLPTKLPRLPAHIIFSYTLGCAIPMKMISQNCFIAMNYWKFRIGFFKVWKAEADDISGHEGLTRLVAVKMVKEGASQREKEDLLRELAIMQELAAHPNVVTLLGCCTDKGSTPYSTMGAREVMRQVLDGYRLEKPKHCKSEFFKVLTKCWHNDPNSRPTFSELKSEIGLLLGTTESEGRFVDLEAMTEEIMDQSH